MKQIDYRINQSSEAQIRLHLKKCSKSFVPSLASYIDIVEYSKKIREHAVCVEAYHRNILIGLIAVYYNDKIGNRGYITNLSVDNEFSGIGVARNLLNLCLDLGRYLKFENIDLEVYSANLKAVHFYEKSGFIVNSSLNNRLKMTLKI